MSTWLEMSAYVRGDVHTNTVEGFFGLLKRGIVGSFHHVSVGHLTRYCDEFSFRYSNRKMSDGARAALIVAGAEGKRLTYRQPPIPQLVAPREGRSKQARLD